MRNSNKLLIAFFSLLFVVSGAFAQNSERTAIKPNFGIAPARTGVKLPATNPALLRGNIAYANAIADTSFHPFVSFDTDEPETFNTINAAPSWLSFAGDFDNVNTDFYYIINWNNGKLQTIEIATGAILNTIGTPYFNGDFVSGMACDKITGIMYVSAIEPNNMNYSSIWTLNLQTAVATLVGQTTPDEAIIDIAIDGAGDMYGFGILNDEGLLINKTTAEATVLGPLGFNANNGQGMAYDPQEDKIYIAAFNEMGAGGELRDFDRVNGASELIGVFPDGIQVDAFGFPGVPETYTTDLGVVTIVSPATGVNLTSAEPVTVRVRNYGTTDASDIAISFTFEEEPTVTETIPSLVAGQILDYTFVPTLDLSEYDTFTIVACVLFDGDENPDNDCKTKVLTNLVPELCFPDYNTGCDWGDGFVDFAVEEIENYGTGCENNTGLTGCSQYLELGPANLTPGNTHTFKVTGGYANQVLNIWIDFNDNLLFDADEMIIADFMIAEGNVLTEIDITIPANATPGLHYMRAMIVWNQYFTESCQHYDIGECEDYMVMIVGGSLAAPMNLAAGIECTDVMLTWEMPAKETPDSYNVYRNAALLGNTTAMDYTDAMVMPETAYTYTVKAVYDGAESAATPGELVTVPTPNNLVPLNPEALVDTPNPGDVTISWDAPAACLAPEGYNVYRNNVQINTAPVSATTFVDTEVAVGSYDYSITAVYYFGESDYAGPVNVVITGLADMDATLFNIYPNPASGMVNIESPVELTAIRVLNNAGQLVMDIKVNAASYQLDVSQLDSGTYFIRLQTNDGSMMQKIVVE